MRNINEVLNSGSVHDKNITELRIINKDVLMKIEDESTAFFISFQKVKQVKMDNFRIGNIIYSITILDKNDKNFGNELSDLLQIDSNNSQYIDYLNRIEKELMEGRLLLVLLESSYGLEGSILCEKIEIIDEL